MRVCYCAHQPPSIKISVPVMKERLIAAQVNSEFSDIFHLAPLPDRDFGQELLIDLGILH